MQKIYLGNAGITTHLKEDTIQYNKLLNQLGTDNMLIQFEGFLNEQMLKDFISHIKDNLTENNISVLGTKKIKLTITKYYSEKAELEIDVDSNLTDDALVDYLTNDTNGNVDKAIVEAFDKSTGLFLDETKYEYYDEETKMGGNL